MRHGWSYKTNYLGAICNVLHQEGAWAEVVSELEYSKARSLGVPGSRIIFNGPWKPAAVLEQAVLDGAAIHLDHLDELYAVEQIARRLGRQVPIGLRLNFDTGHTEPWNRFGFNIESGAAMDAVQRIGASQWLQLTGLHSHIGTFVLDVRAYAQQARIMAEFMEAAERETGCRIEYLDIGGGFASHNAMQGLYLPPDQVVPSFEQYAEAIVEALNEAMRGRTALGKPLPVLVLETGRAIVDDAEVLVTRIVGGKRLPDGRAPRPSSTPASICCLPLTGTTRVRPTRQRRAGRNRPLWAAVREHQHGARLRDAAALNVGDALMISPSAPATTPQWRNSRPSGRGHGHADGSVTPSAGDLQTLTDLERLPETLRLPFPETPPAR